MMEDGFKDEVSLYPVKIENGRNGKQEEYNPEDAAHGLKCRIRKSEDPQKNYKVFFDKDIRVKKGDCIVSASSREVYQVEAVKPVYGKDKLHHVTCIVKSVPNMARLLELVSDGG